MIKMIKKEKKNVSHTARPWANVPFPYINETDHQNGRMTPFRFQLQ